MKKLGISLFLSFVCGMAFLASAQQDSAMAADSAVRDSAATTSVATDTSATAASTPAADSAASSEAQAIAARRMWTAWGLSLLVAVVALVVARNSSRRNKALIKALQQDFDSLKKELADTKTQLNSLPKTASAPHMPLPKPKAAVSAPHAATPKPATPAAPVPRQLYLPKPDANGIFPRATTTFENGNTIFVLTTTDGTNGTFVVVDDPKMQQLALVMPTVNITTACTGQDIQTSHGCKRIVTDTAGTATLINGHWHIKTQATVHYEA